VKTEAMLYKKLAGGTVRCRLCSHHCKIADSESGFCGVRRNEGGTLYSLVFGATIARHIDSIEKKPLFHFLPGTFSYSIATIGCNFKCGFCQNWQISQVDGAGGPIGESAGRVPAEVVTEAKRNGCASIAYTYTEPTIFFEYAYETARLAAQAGLRNEFVTNGYMTRAALDTVGPYLDAVNVDLKSWREDYYRNICKARLKPVLDAIGYMKKLGIWVEVTTLVIPGENDTEEELEGIADFIADLDREIPWHVSRFHPDYRFSDRPPTPRVILDRAAEIGREKGLRYVYRGNVAADEDTLCPACGEPVVKRTAGGLRRNKIVEGRCGRCGAEVAGVWDDAPETGDGERIPSGEIDS